MKQNPEIFPKWEIGFAAFCCSFGAKYWGSYARNKSVDGKLRDFCAESVRNLQRQSPNLLGIVFSCGSYLDMVIKPNSVIYCDPPYAGTTGYRIKFDHGVFWEWVRRMVKLGHFVYVSEYTAPDDFVSIWRKDTLANFHLEKGKNKTNKRRIERLFVHKSTLPEMFQ